MNHGHRQDGWIPQRLKRLFQECWSVSDNRASFARALEEQGLLLARGDRRGLVAVDYRGEVYSLSRWTGQKPRELKGKLGDPAGSPDAASGYRLLDGHAQAIRGESRHAADEPQPKARPVPPPAEPVMAVGIGPGLSGRIGR